MDFIRNPITVNLLAAPMIKACDGYIELQISEKQLKNLMTHYASQHGKKLFSHNGLNPTVENRIGKKRSALVNTMLSGFQTSLWG